MQYLETAATDVTWTRPDADEIEQRIIRAYVQLACSPRERGESRSLIVARLSWLDVRLTEVSSEIPGMPPFWLEVYSNASQSVIDSYGCSEFDEDDLATSVQMILSADLRAHDLRH
ncbi:hypothetical protein HPT29_028275 (plasmid) [Microvirga terrae]|uniref:Uncharacterized protein n=1 Tax=Microvirga terrae TaxID=2740529 RepID=A0ABY5S0H5_9HYPH|nr:hypothetical protein [Microvirga terrae]UVF22709.1 hypothetical protein HPT29_028275 [Microvirga terrae]